MIKNKILIVPIISIFILLSLFISVAYGINNDINKKVRCDNKCIIITSTLLIILLIIFNCYIFFNRYEKPIRFIV